jgi:hypothetical protein
MPRLNQRWANQPTLDFINYSLRGVGQVVFINNPLSGLLILLALFIWTEIIAVRLFLRLRRINTQTPTPDDRT